VAFGPPKGKAPGPKIGKRGVQMSTPHFGPRGLEPPSQKQDGVDGPKVKNKMAAMGQNSKRIWRRWAKSQKKMAAKGRWRGLTK